EGTRRDWIKQRADLIVTGDLPHSKQGMGVVLPCGVLQPAMVHQKRLRLGKKDSKGPQGSILDGVAGVRTRFAMVRQLRGPSVQDVLEDIEAEGSCHDNLLGAVEIVTLTMAISIGNRKHFVRQNENCCAILADSGCKTVYHATGAQVNHNDHDRFIVLVCSVRRPLWRRKRAQDS